MQFLKRVAVSSLPRLRFSYSATVSAKKIFRSSFLHAIKSTGGIVPGFSRFLKFWKIKILAKPKSPAYSRVSLRRRVATVFPFAGVQFSSSAPENHLSISSTERELRGKWREKFKVGCSCNLVKNQPRFT